jgi:hypothetical protein
MRHVSLAVFLTLAAGLGGGRALAGPFEPATVPDQVEAVGHLDADALRKTQIFATFGGDAAIDAVLGNAPPPMQPLARSLVRSIRGVSFWRDTAHGAVYLETRDSRGLAQLLAQMPVKPARSIDGIASYTMDHGKHQGYCAALGDTLVLADSPESLERSIRVLAGKAPSLAGSTKLPAASRKGVFVFVSLGDDALGAIQKAAHSKVLKLGLRTLVVDVGETAGTVTANARAEMRSADALQKVKSILEGMRSMGSLSDDPAARALVDAVSVTTNGLTLEIAAKLPVTEIARMIEAAK